MNVLDTLHQSHLESLPLRARGKVRDIYDVDADHLLIVTTDRISAFDCILPDPIPGKGRVLTAVSQFWFEKLAHVVPNQLTGLTLDQVIENPAERAPLEGRAIVVKKLRALPVEAVVRGYLIGSGWKDYQKTGAVCGIKLPVGLRDSDRLPEPIFTPSTKAETGHDENISFEKSAEIIGRQLAERVRDISIQIYERARDYALERGIIIADTKFEFGLVGPDPAKDLILIDEALTPDSSRFWPADDYAPGRSQPSYDKQYLRDYLETLDWPKTPPPPPLPAEVVANTRSRYIEALKLLTGQVIGLNHYNTGLGANGR